MAVGLSSAFLTSVLDAFGNATNLTAPTAIWVKLHLGDPGASGTANVASNTTREQASFSAASAATLTTDADLVWTSVSASETYSHISFWTASSAGTFLGSAALTSSRAVTTGDTFTIATGDIDMAITPVAA